MHHKAPQKYSLKNIIIEYKLQYFFPIFQWMIFTRPRSAYK